MSTGQPWLEQLIRFVPYIAGVVIFIMLPPFLPTYLQSLMAKVLVFAIFGMSWNLLDGYTGLFSLGHAAYFGIAGYTTGILIMHNGIHSFWITAPCAILIAALTAAVFGFIALRVSGVYFLLMTFAFAMLLYSLALKWTSMFGGMNGLPGIPRPDLGLPWLTWNTANFYYFVFIAFVICFFLMYRFVRSPFGHALQGIRESESRMLALGYNTWLYKYVAFVIAGTFAGVAGMLFAHFNGDVSIVNIGADYSFLVVLIAIIGGTGTFFGPIIGAFVMVLVQYLASIYSPERWPLILGVIFVIIIMYLPTGIAPYLLTVWNKARYGSLKS